MRQAGAREGRPTAHPTRGQCPFPELIGWGTVCLHVSADEVLATERGALNPLLKIIAVWSSVKIQGHAHVQALSSMKKVCLLVRCPMSASQGSGKADSTTNCAPKGRPDWEPQDASVQRAGRSSRLFGQEMLCFPRTLGSCSCFYGPGPRRHRLPRVSGGPAAPRKVLCFGRVLLYFSERLP